MQKQSSPNSERLKLALAEVKSASMLEKPAKLEAFGVAVIDMLANIEQEIAAVKASQ